MARDDFSKQTQDTLAKRVGVRCSNPMCRKLTTGPRTESHHIVNIGVGAHITAASPGGPRYDPLLTQEQRQWIDNGIWLCQNCAKLVDNDPSRYQTQLLRAWKTQAEASALAALEGRAEPLPTDLSAELEISYVRLQIESKRHDYRLCRRGTILYCPVKRKYTVKEKQWVSRSLLFCAYSSSGSQHGNLRFRRFSRYDEPSTLSLPISGIAPIERLTHNPLSKLMGSARGPVLSRTRSLKAATFLIGLSRRN